MHLPEYLIIIIFYFDDYVQMMNLIHVSARPMAHEYYGLVPLHHELK